MTGNIEVFDPVAPCQNQPRALRDKLDGLAGKVIGFIDNSKPNFSYLVDDLAELLVSKYRVAAVVKRGKPTPAIPASSKIMDELVERCDAVITGSGD